MLRRSSEMINRFFYRYIEGALFYRELIDLITQRISRGESRLEVSLDLGISREEIIYDKSSNKLLIRGAEIDFKHLLERIEEDFIYKLIDNKLVRIDLYIGNKYYKLKPVGLDKAPTLEINGIQMHRTVNIDPWTDSYLKVKSLGRVRGLRALDICTGLGYTAINLLRRGVKEIYSIEIDENVLRIAEMNPWSRDLEKINIILGDAYDVIEIFDNEYFHVILHDPPRYSVAGDLYSKDFYRKIYRILRRGGRLFHYTGEPGKHSNVDILKGIKNRLREAGFEEIKWINYAKGFLAVRY